MARNTNFYYSFYCLPREKRQAILAVWDFCRAVDDAVDEGEGGESDRAAALAHWRSELDACYGPREPVTVQGRALAPYVSRFGLPRDALARVIDGVELDLHVRRYDTFEELREYCLRVASAVGLVCLEIFGYRDPASRAYAVELGLALQLTNIIRDVRVDLARDRIYLPREDLDRFGCTEQDLRALAKEGSGGRGQGSEERVGDLPGNVRELLAFQCRRAREHYARAESLLPRTDRRSLAAAEIMGAVYFAILRRIERLGYDVFTERVGLRRPRKAAIALSTWARAMLHL